MHEAGIVGTPNSEYISSAAETFLGGYCPHASYGGEPSVKDLTGDALDILMPRQRGCAPLGVVRDVHPAPELLTRLRDPSRGAPFMQVTGVSRVHPQRDSNPCYRRERATS